MSLIIEISKYPRSMLLIQSFYKLRARSRPSRSDPQLISNDTAAITLITFIECATFSGEGVERVKLRSYLFFDY